MKYCRMAELGGQLFPDPCSHHRCRLGMVAIVWPEATLVVIAMVFALQLLVSAVYQFALRQTGKSP